VILRGRLARVPDSDPERQVLVREHPERFAHQYVEAACECLDDVIELSETRLRLIRSLEMLSGKRQRNPARKHGNILL
jgi:acetyl-CoA carboxylase carboxyltransferase component